MNTITRVIAVLLVGVLVGCTGGGGNHAHRNVAPSARVVRVEADSFSFSPQRITIDAGEDVAVRLRSDDVFHDFVVDSTIGHIVGVDGDETASGGLRIDRPGSYTFYCSVSGHRSAGMEGTIVVR